ncbi:MAG: glycosyltransferase [Acetatifactor sp.]|nr:glycosyltransferase [Acetatifactor sp.]
MEDLISIIVPVYNVEKYLKRCVESLINQTYRELEIILVDDGSKDDSGSICEEYARKDNRIRVIHQRNGGLSCARNTGIENATGEYLLFVDSDDYISLKMCETLLNIIRQEEADIAICRYRRFGQERFEGVSDGEHSVRTLTTMEALEALYGPDGEVFTVSWNKLYRRRVIGEIRFPVGKINEDEHTTYRFLTAARKIVFTSEVLYYYFRNSASITTDGKYLASTDIYEALDERLTFFKNHGFPQLEAKTQRQYLDRIIIRNKGLYEAGAEDAKGLHIRYKKRFKQVKGMVPGMGYRLYYFAPGLYYGLLKWKQR